MDMTTNQRRAYESSLREQRRAAALAYKLAGGRLNDAPKRKPDISGAFKKVLREKGDLLRG